MGDHHEHLFNHRGSLHGKTHLCFSAATETSVSFCWSARRNVFEEGCPFVDDASMPTSGQGVAESLDDYVMGGKATLRYPYSRTGIFIALPARPSKTCRDELSSMQGWSCLCCCRSNSSLQQPLKHQIFVIRGYLITSLTTWGRQLRGIRVNVFPMPSCGPSHETIALLTSSPGATRPTTSCGQKTKFRS